MLAQILLLNWFFLLGSTYESCYLYDYSTSQYMRYDGSLYMSSSVQSIDDFVQYIFYHNLPNHGNIANYGSVCESYLSSSEGNVFMGYPPAVWAMTGNWNMRVYTNAETDYVLCTSGNTVLALPSPPQTCSFHCRNWLVVYYSLRVSFLRRRKRQTVQRPTRSFSVPVSVEVYRYFLNESDVYQHVAVKMRMDSNNCYLACQLPHQQTPPQGMYTCSLKPKPILVLICTGSIPRCRNRQPHMPDDTFFIAEQEQHSPDVYFRCHSDPSYVLAWTSQNFILVEKNPLTRHQWAVTNVASFPYHLRPTLYRPSQKQRPGGRPPQQPGTGPTQQPGTGPTQRPGKGPQQGPGKGPPQQPGTGPTPQPGTGPPQQPGTGPTQRPGTRPPQRPGKGPQQRG